MDTSNNTPAVLVVDDDAIVLATVRRALENTGYRVLAVSTVREALDLARAKQGAITVAILDYGLPEMSGTDLGDALTQLLPGLRVLISSGMPAGSIRLKTGQHFLDKPFNARTLLAAVLGEVLGASATGESQ